MFFSFVAAVWCCLCCCLKNLLVVCAICCLCFVLFLLLFLFVLLFLLFLLFVLLLSSAFAAAFWVADRRTPPLPLLTFQNVKNDFSIDYLSIDFAKCQEPFLYPKKDFGVPKNHFGLLYLPKRHLYTKKKSHPFPESNSLRCTIVDSDEEPSFAPRRLFSVPVRGITRAQGLHQHGCDQFSRRSIGAPSIADFSERGNPIHITWNRFCMFRSLFLSVVPLRCRREKASVARLCCSVRRSSSPLAGTPSVLE